MHHGGWPVHLAVRQAVGTSRTGATSSDTAPVLRTNGHFIATGRRDVKPPAFRRDVPVSRIRMMGIFGAATVRERFHAICPPPAIRHTAGSMNTAQAAFLAADWLDAGLVAPPGSSFPKPRRGRGTTSVGPIRNPRQATADTTGGMIELDAPCGIRRAHSSSRTGGVHQGSTVEQTVRRRVSRDSRNRHGLPACSWQAALSGERRPAGG
jgi:hypothetical protein